MNTKRLLIFQGALLLLGAAAAGAQTEGAAASSASSTSLVLDPFDVTSARPNGYQATHSISGTALNTPLKDLPLSINVITSEFLDDSLVGGLAEALKFNSSITQTNRQPIAIRADSWSIRGFRNRNTLVDGVTAGEFVPTQLIDRIEIVKGPNTLYGQSDPGGLINIITKRPQGADRFTVTQKAGNEGILETDLDANVVSRDRRLGLRVLGAHSETDGYKVVDGKEENFAGLVGDYRLTRSTKLLFHLSGSRTHGIPVQRGTFAFERVPTDLNGDGDTTDVVDGLSEATVRYNSTFLPRSYTSATAQNHFTQENLNRQLSVQQALGEKVDLQYTFVRTDQDLEVNFREYNTFNAAGSSDANHTYSDSHNRTDAHTLNAVFRLQTGALQHNLLAGARYTYDWSGGADYSLRTLGSASEQTALADLIASGRKIRLYLTKADVLGGVKYWEDDVPTDRELQALGTRGSSTDYSESRVNSYYVTDNVSLLDNRLKVLGGVRYVRIRGQSTSLTGAKGILSDQDDFSYQGGTVFALTPTLSAFANYATAFNPNGADDDGVFYDPERSSAYEGGLKFDGLWQGRIGGSLAYFDIKKKNVIRSDYNPVTFKSDTEISDDESKGAELEVFVNVTPAWQTVIGYSYIDAKTVKSSTLAKGLRLEGAAPHRLTSWTSYGFTQGPLKGLRFGGGVQWAKGPIQQFGTSNNRFIYENGYTVFNAFARFETRFAGHATTLGVNVDNLTNVFYIQSRAGTNDPRKIVFSVRFDL